MLNKIILINCLLLVFCSVASGQKVGKSKTSYKNEYQKFAQLNHAVDSFNSMRKTYLIPKLIEADSNKSLISRHFLWGKPFKAGWSDRIVTYNSISQTYIRNGGQNTARIYAKKILVLDPEYFQVHREADLKYLLPRFSSLKFTVGFFGWGSVIWGQQREADKYQPVGAKASEEKTSPDTNLQSSIFVGAELIANPRYKIRNKSLLRSIDLYSEIMNHVCSFYIRQRTDFSQESGNPAHVENYIFENQRWVSYFLYPRVRFNLMRSENLSFLLLAGGGVNFLTSAHFYTITQSLNYGGTVELSPIKLYTKEKMRNPNNISIIVGLGFNYRVTENIGLTIEARYLRMLNSVVSEYSHINNPLQNSPLYYADNDLFIRQLSVGVGVALNLGACPKWLGYK